MPRTATTKSATKSHAKAPSRGTSKKAAKTVLDMLAADHKKVQKMFKDFEKIQDDDAAKQQLVETCCAELTIHDHLEEELFYPALRDTIKQVDLINEAQVEHATAKQLIAELSSMQPDEELYDAKFTVLGEYVKHHIEEEEKEIFPKAKKAGLDLEAMAEEAQERKLELQEEFGMAPEEKGKGRGATGSTTGRSIH
jgi:hemerythrin superfamily protein